MAHIARSIEVEEPVGAIYEQWMRFEEHPCCPVQSIETEIRFRSEVMTFEPLGDRTRVTLRLEYEPGRADASLAARLDRTLEGFRAFVARRPGAAHAAPL